MPLSERVETAIAAALATTRGDKAPKRLAEALEYATMPGGARIRPTILLSKNPSSHNSESIEAERANDIGPGNTPAAVTGGHSWSSTKTNYVALSC